MAAKNVLYSKAFAAADFLERALLVIEELGSSHPVTLDCKTAFSDLKLSATEIPNNLRKTTAIQAAISNWKQIDSVTVDHARIAILGHDIQYEAANGPYAVLAVTAQSTPQPQVLIRIISTLQKIFKCTTYMDAAATADNETIQNAMIARERSVATLEAQVIQLGKLLSELTIKASEDSRKHREHFEHQLAEQQRKMTEAFEHRNQQADAAIQLRQRELDRVNAQKEADFRKRVTDHEERESAFLRTESKLYSRNVHKELTTLLEQFKTLSISKDTQTKRRPVHYAFAACAIIGSLLLAVGVYLVATVTPFDWHTAIPLFSGSLILVPTLIWYIRWMDRWFQEHAHAELETRRYRADVLRAQWVSELVMGCLKENTPLPEYVLACFTKGMFQPVVSESIDHPLTEIPNALKRIRRVKVDKDGLEAELK